MQIRCKARGGVPRMNSAIITLPREEPLAKVLEERKSRSSIKKKYRSPGEVDGSSLGLEGSLTKEASEAITNWANAAAAPKKEEPKMGLGELVKQEELIADLGQYIKESRRMGDQLQVQDDQDKPIERTASLSRGVVPPEPVPTPTHSKKKGFSFKLRKKAPSRDSSASSSIAEELAKSLSLSASPAIMVKSQTEQVAEEEVRPLSIDRKSGIDRALGMRESVSADDVNIKRDVEQQEDKDEDKSFARVYEEAAAFQHSSSSISGHDVVSGGDECRRSVHEEEFVTEDGQLVKRLVQTEESQRAISIRDYQEGLDAAIDSGNMDVLEPEETTEVHEIKEVLEDGTEVIRVISTKRVIERVVEHISTEDREDERTDSSISGDESPFQHPGMIAIFIFSPPFPFIKLQLCSKDT
ncbi:Ankyrin-2 [Cichlidogyrus casuarinus]|uniref:Ankyrin-2 n=1 Tax=Cichlidogyrus casuarinus TaxID=1844966 RepID=A0ABD2Q9E7_9PLAT